VAGGGGSGATAAAKLVVYVVCWIHELYCFIRLHWIKMNKQTCRHVHMSQWIIVNTDLDIGLNLATAQL